MSAAPRTALWGGRDGEGEERGGEKEEDPLRGGGRGRRGAGEEGEGREGRSPEWSPDPGGGRE